jgi:hypothetical protein
VTNLRRYFTQRGPLLGCSALLGLLSVWGQVGSRSHDAEGVRGALSAGSNTTVGNFFWEPSRGIVGDYLRGRPVLFEAREGGDPGTQRDIFRTFVRLSPEGRVLAVSQVRNLTDTKSADEFGIRGKDAVALFATRSKKAPPSMSFLDLRGESPRPELSPLARLQLAIAAYLETGTTSGLGRSDLFLPEPKPGDSIGVLIENDAATLHAGGKEKVVSLKQLFKSRAAQGSSADKSDLSFIVRNHEAQPWAHFGANTGRSLFGAEAIAWLEGGVFSTWDWFQRTSYSLGRREKNSTTPTGVSTPVVTGSAGIVSKIVEVAWPPLPLARRAGTHSNDGIWRAVDRKILPKDPEPLFYRTILHPDPERPYSELHLVAMDMRRLELGMGAGYEDPHPDTGPPGSGQLPSDPDLAPRVVATFNGAFKAVHGRYGMKAEGRLLVEPVVGAATVTIDRAGRAGFGTWGSSNDESEVVALRQNLDPLIAEGEVNPHERKVWGEHLYGAGVVVERSALCLHEGGQVLYAWATEATGLSLARGLKDAGCRYAIHLDMNPGHCAFLFNRVDSIDPLSAVGETLDPRMRVNPTRFIRWSPKDFFYLARRATLPRAEGIEWQVAPGARSSPQFPPGVFVGSQKLGTLSLSFDRIKSERLSFVALPGSEEKRTWGDPEPVEGQPPEGALIAWGLGHQTNGARSGLTLGARVLVDLKRDLASLVIEDGRLQLLPPSEALKERASAQIIQLPILARDGILVAEANELGGKRGRAALCIDPQGDLLIARMIHDTPAPLAQALLDQKCTLVVEMDRGSHPPPLVQRSETDQPPTKGHQQTMLYGLSRPMRPLTYAF